MQNNSYQIISSSGTVDYPPSPEPPSSVYPFWSADSYWHKKIPVNAPAHPNSVQMINWLKSIPEHNNGHPTINWKSWTEPQYDAYASTTKYSVYDEGHSKYLYNVPIPSGATPSSDADHLMGIVDWGGRVYYRFWNMRIEGGNWRAGSAGSWSLDGSGVTPNGVWLTGASSLAGLAIMIRPEQIEAGVIEHPLACCLKYPKAARVYPPASSYDKRGSTNQYAIPFGARIQLDPSINLDSLGLSRTAKIVAKAKQDYGIVVKEMGGGFVLYAEHDLTANWADWGMTGGLLFSIPANWRVVDYSVFGAVEE